MEDQSIKSNELQNKSGVILCVQSTYIEVSFEGLSKRLRINFDRPLRRSKIQGSFKSFSLSNTHPLSLLHEATTGRISFHTGPDNPQDLLCRLEYITKKLFDDWVGLDEFINPCFLAEKLKKDSMGQLLEGPITLVKALEEELKDSRMEFSIFTHERTEREIWTLTFDDMYIVTQKVDIL